jgi:hypothetical protein
VSIFSTILLSGCGVRKNPEEKVYESKSVTSSEESENEWGMLKKSADGLWTLESVTNEFSDLRLRLVGQDGRKIELTDSGELYGADAFSPDSKWLLILSSEDKAIPDDKGLFAIRLDDAERMIEVTKKKGSIDLPFSYKTAIWEGDTVRFSTPESSYNPARETMIDLVDFTYSVSSSSEVLQVMP